MGGIGNQGGVIPVIAESYCLRAIRWRQFRDPAWIWIG